MRANVQFSCWSGGEQAPASHCVLIGEDPEGCGLVEKAAAYLNRGSPTFLPASDHPEGTWFRMVVWEDKQGRMGIKSHHDDATEFLSHHDQSPPMTSLDVGLPPKWPRWPRGLEYGPEQQDP